MDLRLKQFGLGVNSQNQNYQFDRHKNAEYLILKT